MSHNIIDPDTHFIVDADDRSITNESGERFVVMQYDHNSERMTFELPRYIEGHDMFATNLVLVLFTNTSKGTSVSNRSTSAGVYQVTDLEIKKDHPDTLTCSWLVSREATQYVGTLKFQIQLVCHENGELGIPEYYWHTDQCDMIDVKPSLSSGNDVGEAYPDILTSMDARISILEDNGVPDDRLGEAVNEYLTKHPIEKLTAEELRSAIDAYFVDNPVDEVTDEYIEGIIEQYLKDHPVKGESMTTQEFNTRTENYISTRPMDSNTEDKINSLIAEYLENNSISGNVTQEELIEAIRLYFIDYPIPGLTEEQLASAIENYFIDHPIKTNGTSQLPINYYANMFTTSKKIQKYENKDTSLDYFIRVEGSSIWWYYGEYDGGTEILDGIYWIDEIHSALTATPTDYPVTVYTYTEHVRMQVEVGEDETHGPKWTFGSGAGYDHNPDGGKVFLEKTAELTKFYLLNKAGNEIGFDISENHVDIKGLRKPTNIDFTDVGFTVTMDGGGSIGYTYTKDASGNITAITDSAGHVTKINHPG